MVNVSTEEQKADVLTKALPRVNFQRMCDMIGVQVITDISQD